LQLPFGLSSHREQFESAFQTPHMSFSDSPHELHLPIVRPDSSAPASTGRIQARQIEESSQISLVF
jgi:hypothetical protein